VTVTPLTKDELLALPVSTNLATLGLAYGLSEPTARECHRRGEWASLGIRVNRCGRQWRVVTEDILAALGVSRDSEGGPSPPEPPVRR
jgi:hypothetical protein